MTFEVNNLSEHLNKFNKANHLYVGYSGGLDSHVLLHVIIELIGKKRITAVHVNHQLSSNSDIWQKHCEDRCLEIGVDIICKTVSIKNRGTGIEDAARNARYSVFEKLLKKNDLLILAHHADDQIETMLFRLFRGSGIKGMSGMPISRLLGNGELFRPLLPFFRRDLESYASANQINWIEDDSNLDIAFDRNFIRHKLIPTINERWPNSSFKLNRSANIFAESDFLINILAQKDFKIVKEVSERVGWSISIDKLNGFEIIRQKNILRYWFNLHNLTLPSYAVLDNALNQMIGSKIDAEPIVSWGDLQLRRFNKKLYLLPLNFEDPNYSVKKKKGRELLEKNSIKWDGSSHLILPDSSSLCVKLKMKGGLRIDVKKNLEIRFRSGGERCKPQGRSGSNTLKKLFQEYSLEPWLRNNIPLIYIDNRLAAVGDLWVCDEFCAEPDELGIQLEWLH
jgi:tRNA(Ile)-lysidine synthase